MKKPMWIWFYGDFELYHNLKLSMRRKQYDCFLPAFWRVSDCNRCVRFRKIVTLDAAEKITFISDGNMNVKIDDENRSETTITLEKGTHTIVVGVYNPVGIPALYVKGKTIVSDESWEADNVMTLYGADYKPVGYWNLYNKSVTPTNYPLPTKKMTPVVISKKNKEVIFDFGKEVNIRFVITPSDSAQSVKVFYGESIPEVMDNKKCVLSDKVIVTDADFVSDPRGCRYVRITGELKGEIYGLSEYLPKNPIGKFRSSSKLLNKIYSTSEYTYDLTSNLFFVDGVKRDGWIWGGDAYQSILFDLYYCFDKDVIKRTLIALRGRDPISSHINGIVDYTFYWIISLSMYYLYTGDIEFVRNIYGDAKSLLEYCEKNLDENGFFVGDESIWTFVDWADVEKSGAVSAIQMLYCKALCEFSKIAEAVGNNEDCENYKSRYEELKNKINSVYWDENAGGYITSLIDNKPTGGIKRHANVFAVIFDIASEFQKEKILNEVLLNDDIAKITTPFFSFFEYDAMASLGQFEIVRNRIEEYWGGMIAEGTDTFWEEYDPEEKGIEKYAMYGNPFERSLCHAWGASPLYLIGKYFAGVTPTKPGYKEFEIKPNLCGLDYFNSTIPVNNGYVKITANQDGITVISSVAGGFVNINGIRTDIEENKTYIFKNN